MDSEILPFTVANTNFRYFVGAPERMWAARAMGDRQGFHGYTTERALSDLELTSVEQWEHLAQKAIDCPLDVFKLDLPKFGMHNDLQPRPLGLSAELLVKMRYGDASDHFRDGGLTSSQWEAYVHVWRTSADHVSDVGISGEAEPTDEFTLFYAEQLRSRIGRT